MEAAFLQLVVATWAGNYKIIIAQQRCVCGEGGWIMENWYQIHYNGNIFWQRIKVYPFRQISSQMKGKNPLIHHTGCPFCLFLRGHASVRPFVSTAITRQYVPVIMAQAIILCQQTWLSWSSLCFVMPLLCSSSAFPLYQHYSPSGCRPLHKQRCLIEARLINTPRCPFSHLTKGLEQLRGGTEKLCVCVHPFFKK